MTNWVTMVPSCARERGTYSETSFWLITTPAARGVIRDVGRVLDMPYAQVDSIAKMVPAKVPNVTI